MLKLIFAFACCTIPSIYTYQSKNMSTYRFDEVLELVEELSEDDQLTLTHLITQRLREKRRDEIALNITRANEDYAHGKVFRGSVEDIMKELKK
jgi:hypothetical protein